MKLEGFELLHMEPAIRDLERVETQYSIARDFYVMM